MTSSIYRNELRALVRSFMTTMNNKKLNQVTYTFDNYYNYNGDAFVSYYEFLVLMDDTISSYEPTMLWS